MNYKKCFAAIAIVAIALCAVFGIVVEKNNIKTGIDLTATSVSADTTKQFFVESQGNNFISKTDLLEKPAQENEPIATETPSDIQIDTFLDKVTQPEVFAKITIKTCEKTGTFVVMPDVNEKTLDNHIGWLPSSSLPGEEGLCVLMGHIDTDFSILQYVNEGDIISIYMGKLSISYVVTEIEIVNSDNELKFKIASGSNLALVTCYPFRYTGNAPKKYVVLCRINIYPDFEAKA